MFLAGHLKEGVWLIGLGLEMPLEDGFFSHARNWIPATN
jgi:hypothetical protein